MLKFVNYCQIFIKLYYKIDALNIIQFEKTSQIRIYSTSN